MPEAVLNQSGQALRRVLVVDDEHLVAEGIAAQLRDLEYEVVAICPNAERAVEECRNHHPDLVLMDIRLPGTSGLDAARTIFEELDIPVMIVSAYSDPEYAMTSANIGVFGYLIKPVNSDDLRTALPVAWSQYQSYRVSHEEIARLKQLLENRKFVEKAKWVLVDQLGIPEDEALKRLQKQARDSRRPLVEVAQHVIDNRKLFSSDA